MAFMISPGVNVSEIDLTTIVPAVGTTVGALAGPFRWGPCMTRVLTSSELDIINRFYKPDINCFPTWFTGTNFLGYGQALWVTRVVGPAASNACVIPPTITPGDTPFQVLNEDQYLTEFAGGQGFQETTVGMWAAKWPGDLGNSLAVSMADSANFANWTFKTSFNQPPNTSSYVSKAGGSNDEIHVVVVDAGGMWTGTPGTVLESFPYLSKCAAAKNADGTTMYYADVLNRTSNYIWWMDYPEFSKDGTETWGTSTLGTAFEVMSTKLVTASITGTFTVGETVQFATTATVADPTSGTTATIALTLDPITGAVKAASVTNHGSGYTTAPTITVTGPGSGAVLVASIASGQVTVVSVSAAGTGYLAKIATVLSVPVDGTGIFIVPVKGTFGISDVVTGVTSQAFGTVNDIEGGVAAAYAQLSGGVDDNANIQAGDLMLGYDLYKSGEDVDIALLLTGNCGGVQNIDDMIAVLEEAINIVEYRKDCVVFISPPQSAVVSNPGNEATDTVAFRGMLPDSSYTVMDSGWKYQYDKYNDAFRWVPLNGDIAGLCVRTDTVRDPWWSPAGFNRGQIQSVVRLAWNPRQADRDLLYQNNVNPVITTTGDGTVLYGDKTLLSKPSAFDRINVRRLFIVLEKAIATAAKYSLFEFNDAFTQASFTNMVEPFLRDVQGRRGIYDFKVVCDSTNNTPQVIDSNQFVGDIYIKPARSINFIQLNFVAVSTGVSFDEVVGQF